MLDRLGVQQKLSLLLTLPLAALVLTGVPFAVGRIDEAIAARATVDAARDARQVAGLVEDLQQERLLALSTLVSPGVDRSAYVAYGATSTEHARQVAGVRDAGVRRAVADLASLDDLRKQVVDRSAAPAQVQQVYHARIVALIDALGLTGQHRADLTGLRQLSALDALLRGDEEANRVGAALLVATTDTRGGANLAIEARALRRTDADRFRQQADADQVALFDAVEIGAAARRLEELAGQVGDGDGVRGPLAETVAAAQTVATLARAAQDPIVRDIGVRARDRAAAESLGAGILIGLAVTLIICVIWLGIAVSRSVALPLRRLTAAARVVADLGAKELFRVADTDTDTDDSRPPKLAAVDVCTSDEIGELAVAFNRVQTTAALLMEQQVANRRNVSVMFANIARRTRSLVARQLTFIDEFERNEQDERMLARLYRLDHLTTRLRRSADSLLVVSGIREDERLSAEAPLLEVVRSAIAEIEGYQAIRLPAVCDVTILPQLVADLRLLLAEVLENATTYSPPGTPVEVYARLSGDCQITVVDHGIGMSDERLAEENNRLVERERLEVAPTSALGLFVVGRLARRHGLRVQLRHSPGQGVSVEVRIPPTQFTTDRVLSRQVPPPAVAAPFRFRPGGEVGRDVVRLGDWAAAQRDDSFAWFEAEEMLDGAAPAALPAAPATPVEPAAHDGLKRREPGGHLPTFDLDPAGEAPPGRGGLTRREPGTHIDRSLRAEDPAAAHRTQVRDPDAERAELDSFVAGVTRASAAPNDATANQ